MNTRFTMQSNSTNLFGDPDTRLKFCRLCSQKKPIAEFPTYLNGKTGYRNRHSYCKPCCREYGRRNHQTPRRQKSHWLHQLRSKYGIDEKTYTAMLTDCGGLCTICRKPESCKNRRGEVRKLAVDHCHRTGKVRGLLCQQCNQAIARLRDDPILCRAAAEYLEKNQLG